MSTRRPILIALIALAVALLPMAGRMALAMPHDISLTASHADCCPNDKPCEKKTDDCGSLAGCVFICCSVLPSLPAPIEVERPGFASEKPAVVPRKLPFSLRDPAAPTPSDLTLSLRLCSFA